jgi:aldose 1-epimerase
MPACALIIILLAAATSCGRAVSPFRAQSATVSQPPPPPAPVPAPAFHTIKNATGSEIRLASHGARLVSWLAPDRAGNRADILLGCDTIAGYDHPIKHSFGATIGRYANRIAAGRFTLDGISEN